jgi:tetratricopeptide (TPR) repeat protein
MRVVVAAVIVAAAAFAIFAPTLGHGFVNWDDDAYVYSNPVFQPLTAQGIGWIVSHFYYYAYIPVTLLSHAADVAIWGMNPRGHHATNVLLHSANAVWVLLLGLLLLRVGPGEKRAPGSSDLIGMTLAELLFAIQDQPAAAGPNRFRGSRTGRFSSAASSFCVALIQYARRRGGEGEGWWAAPSLFLLAALSKSAAVVFPFLALLLDWLWLRRPSDPRGRTRLVLEKIPFFLVSLILAALSLSQAPNALKAYAVSHLSVAEGYLFPFYSVMFALYKTALPIRLEPIYPRVAMGPMIACAFLVLAITALSTWVALRGRRGPILVWLSYLLLLLPNVVGLSSGMQPVADRYSYLSTLGFFLFLGGAVSWAWERGGMRRLAAVAGCAVLVPTSAAWSLSQSARWRSSISLWEYVVASSPPRPDYADAYLNLGTAYAQSGRNADARRVLERAAAIDPGRADVLENLGVIQYGDGDREKAAESFRRATEADPRLAVAFYNLAIVSDELGRSEEALAAMTRAARLGSTDAQEALKSYKPRP